ncbi:isoprenyl transferase [Carnobacterium maltaromaticum]|uniref:isoprenyl transferase n=1 Tax=Carnobacterium maltaromaticum TaxID=2751 RepID=UPI00070503E0|nr:isoprenyl transferase [Carnobacterium maltaromaticum]MBC9788552.1 isoprenyl transferase [Carnobacterium maltaromaticum]MDT1944141.1 isoprenyl transferase [Carnobacterium maltaromaticum]MDT1998137.1 isoprenyl transferase [Carnobacterium maltaromaticum]TFJ26883.1 isoprenyl transferase [Carnobacterium maltaromaticum]TFJ30955.1 isoprenyl transferase [Carnobacterium maltaromaticum]
MKHLFKRKGKQQAGKNPHPFQENEVIPNHIAIIMDGNGRWAQKKFLPRVAGHREGMNTVKKITKHANKLGVKVLTLYAFSTENWKRPTDEVSFLMQLPVDFFDTFVPDLIKENVKVNVMGFVDQLPDHTKKAVEKAIEDTKHNTGMILNFALNYGSRSEMLEATKIVAEKVQNNQLKLDEITEEVYAEALMTHTLGDYQDPDLLVRTSGEERISNFLLWQVAYSEFYFSKVLWPDFDEDVLETAIGVYQTRHRRFGGL